MTEPEAKREAAEILREDANLLAAWLEDNKAAPARVQSAVRMAIARIRLVETTLRGE